MLSLIDPNLNVVDLGTFKLRNLVLSPRYSYFYLQFEFPATLSKIKEEKVLEINRTGFCRLQSFGHVGIQYS